MTPPVHAKINANGRLLEGSVFFRNSIFSFITACFKKTVNNNSIDRKCIDI